MKDTHEINGDLTLDRNLTVGGSTELRGPGRVKGNLIVEGWLEAKNIRGAAKGMFRTAKRLHAIYPRPSDGWWALVPKNDKAG
ncbi:MAG: hypothetical protein K2H61_09465, partial [Muribaculaceae bacterium]|nr:hypothetical protein [Muribaculaceae bacterium]